MYTSLLIYLVYALVMLGITYINTRGNIEEEAVTPSEFYDTNNFNMFGCVLLCILWVVLNPLLPVVRFLYWIFHVGRKN